MNQYPVSYIRIRSRDPRHVGIQKYINQDSLYLAATAGHNDRLTVNQCLLHGYGMSYEPRYFKGALDEVPRLMEYGRKVDDLRRKYCNFVWNGEYLDTLEASVKTADGQPLETYTVFRDRQTGKRAAVIANFDYHNPIDVHLTFENSGACLAMATPEFPDAQPTDGRIGIPAASTVVVMEQ